MVYVCGIFIWLAVEVFATPPKQALIIRLTYEAIVLDRWKK